MRLFSHMSLIITELNVYQSRQTTPLGTPRATSVSLYYGVSGESRVVTIANFSLHHLNGRMVRIDDLIQ